MENIELSPWELWSHSLVWALIGIAFIKLLVYPRDTKFRFWFWIKDNLRDVALGLLLTLITIKLGAIIVDVLKLVGVDLTGIDVKIKEAGFDPVQLALIIAMVFQWQLWKRRKKE